MTTVTTAAMGDPASEAPRDVTTGSRLPAPRDLALPRGEVTSIRGAHDYARCAVVHRGGMVRRLLDSTAIVEETKVAREIAVELTCNGIPGILSTALARQINMPIDIERGILAEAYLDEHASRFSYSPMPPSKSYPDSWSPVSGRPAAVDEMAICMAQTDPQQISALLNTTPATPGETNAIRAMIPALGTCLVAGSSLNANAQSLRAELAEALYHRWASTQAPVDSVAAK